LRRRIDGGPVYHRSDEKMVAEAAFVAFLLFVFLVPFERQRSDGAAARAAKFPISAHPTPPAAPHTHLIGKKQIAVMDADGTADAVTDGCHGRRRDGGRLPVNDTNDSLGWPVGDCGLAAKLLPDVLW
jgi:hypothetical protein